MSRVFIGIPTVNRPELVKHTIMSVLNQTYIDFIAVVSDNCSEPEAAAEVARYVEQLHDPRISYFLQPANGGEYGQGRYFMAQSSDCDYFMMLHDDDVLVPEYLAEAVVCLDQEQECAFFVADPFLINEKGEKLEKEQTAFLKEHGRFNTVTGIISVATTHLGCGFTPISATLFRRSQLDASGFVDPDASGNYPFECDVFLRLADINARAWYLQRPLFGLRLHSTSMRHYLKLRDNQKVVDAMIKLFEPRRYQGFAEQRRKAILSNFYRAKAMIFLRQGRYEDSKRMIKKCFLIDWRSIKLWLVAPLIFLLPKLLNVALPTIPEHREAPKLK